MKRGFTLIELLAVIVILAIIALIATPIVLSIISDSKISTTERSAENYLDAVEQAIAHEKMTNVSFNPTTCTISVENSKSVIKCDGIALDVNANGKLPTNGIITLTNGKIDKVTNLKFDNYFVNKTNGKLVASTKTVSTAICKAVTASTKTTGNVPSGNFNYGDEYTCELGDGIQRTFFVLENGDTTTLTKWDGRNSINSNDRIGIAGREEVSLIMNQNLGNAVDWVTEADWLAAGGVVTDAMRHDNNNCEWGSVCIGTDKGPITANNYLLSQTTNWNKLNQNQIALPTAQQIAQVDGIDHNNLPNIASLWLKDYLGDSVHPASKYSYYWTLTITGPTTPLYYHIGSNIIYAMDGLTGIRPVITIPKTMLEQ